MVVVSHRELSPVPTETHATKKASILITSKEFVIKKGIFQLNNMLTHRCCKCSKEHRGRNSSFHVVTDNELNNLPPKKNKKRKGFFTAIATTTDSETSSIKKDLFFSF